MASPDDGQSQVYQWNFTDMIVTHIHLSNRPLFLLLIFCSLLILTGSLLLYAHCLYRHRSVSNTGNALIISPPALSLGLDPTIINSMPIILHHSPVMSNNIGTGTGTGTAAATSVNMETECCICLGRFEDGQKLKVLQECHHAYHGDCLDKWLATHSSCPLCRASLLQAKAPDGTVIP
ncbi:RING-H2 finger protein [Melia azedarach]|uniref:RING-H2 finger protein n=1 Tax=Melia azedarach TaxID=155640 RepID=A0ACC1YQ39_MELAZ|nr:RING-H2 finger protein [Melia azedarach]